MESFTHCGFRFESSSSAISNAGTLETISHSLFGDAEPGATWAPPPLPEQTFGSNALTITHVQTGESLSFTTRGALRTWNAQQISRLGIEHAHATLFDWTYTCPYDGDFNGPNMPHLAPLEGVEASLPLERLVARTPILHYAVVPLFADELHDRGHSEVGVKLRVQPDCFLVLLQSFVRIDGERVWLREVRWYVELEPRGAAATSAGWCDGLVWKDVQLRRGSVAQVRAALASSSSLATTPSATRSAQGDVDSSTSGGGSADEGGLRVREGVLASDVAAVLTPECTEVRATSAVHLRRMSRQ